MQRFWYTRMITKADQGLLEELFKSAKSKEESALHNIKAIEAREAELAKMEAEALKVCRIEIFAFDILHPNLSASRVC